MAIIRTGIKVAVINASESLDDREVQEVVPALERQVKEDLIPIWGVDVDDLMFVPKGKSPPKGYWWLTMLDRSDQPGAGGYHDLTDEALPVGKVFAKTEMDNGSQWTVAASHELLEMLIDPDINMVVTVEDGVQMTLYAYEVCDACEADKYGYKIDNVLVSDFVYPSWFESFHKGGSSTKFDKEGHIKRPFQLLPGGYIGVYNVSSSSGWYQKYPREETMTEHMRPYISSRRERRRTPRDQWLLSRIGQKRSEKPITHKQWALNRTGKDIHHR
jgi:hypothetical protein